MIALGLGATNDYERITDHSLQETLKKGLRTI